MGDNDVVRRADALAASKEEDSASISVRLHQGKGISVESRLYVGVEPAITLIWNLLPAYIAKGYTLSVFRSATSFSPKPYPDDLSAHGALIVETTESGRRTDCLPEGTYFYTFLLRKAFLFGLWEDYTLVRLSETIPTAKIGIDRIQDQMQLRDLAHRRDVAGYEYEAKLNEAEIQLLESRRLLERARGNVAKLPGGDPIVAEEIAAADTLVEMYLASETSIEHLKQNPKFQKLPAERQQELIDWMKERLDVGELSARREMRKP